MDLLNRLQSEFISSCWNKLFQNCWELTPTPGLALMWYFQGNISKDLWSRAWFKYILFFADSSSNQHHGQLLLASPNTMPMKWYRIRGIGLQASLRLQRFKHKGQVTVTDTLSLSIRELHQEGHQGYRQMEAGVSSLFVMDQGSRGPGPCTSIQIPVKPNDTNHSLYFLSS